MLGALAYLLVFRPLRNHRPVAKAVASIGLMGCLTAVVTYQVGTQVLLVNPIFPQNHVNFLGIDISTDRLWLAATIIGLGIVLTVSSASPGSASPRGPRPRPRSARWSAVSRRTASRS